MLQPLLFFLRPLDILRDENKSRVLLLARDALLLVSDASDTNDDPRFEPSPWLLLGVVSFSFQLLASKVEVGSGSAWTEGRGSAFLPGVPGQCPLSLSPFIFTTDVAMLTPFSVSRLDFFSEAVLVLVLATL